MRSRSLLLSVLALAIAMGCGDEPEPPGDSADTAPVPVDGDGDGWAVDAGDCDDGDPGVNPDADEVCDGVDNDCDGYADLGAVDGDSGRLDVDGDGDGCETCVASACEQPAGRVADNTDCDDDDAAVNPGEEELCDGIDNDCDGVVDGGCD